MHHIIGHNFEDIIHTPKPPIAPIMSSQSPTAKPAQINLTCADIWSPFVI